MPEQFADAVAHLDANNRWALNIAGDAAFFAGARLWLTRFNDSTATTEDFEAVMEKASGQQLDAFFDDWLREGDRPAMPQLSVRERSSGGKSRDGWNGPAPGFPRRVEEEVVVSSSLGRPPGG